MPTRTSSGVVDTNPIDQPTEIARLRLAAVAVDAVARARNAIVRDGQIYRWQD